MNTTWRGLSGGATKVALTYVVASATWIVVTDWWVPVAFETSREFALFQTGKGLVFISLSGLLIFTLVRHEQRELATTNEELERTLKHATVLHRLLRHNLRNSCDVIRNNVELLESDKGDQGASRDRIRRQAESMSTIAAKSQHLRDVATDGNVEAVEQDLVALVEESVATVRRQYPDATFVVEPSPTRHAVAHPRLAVAIEELLANAVAHHDAPSPRVTVSIERVGAETLLRIADDGPGLPDIERTVLEEGVEEALTHSRGIGLWVVRFIVTASGGTLSVPTSSSDGTVVVLGLPTVD